MVALDQKLQALRRMPSPAAGRAWREAAGLSQNDLAAELNVTRAAISRWESGDRRPRGSNLIAYVGLLDRLRREVA